ncbi:MAG: ABC transporter substrate-binding protein [Clostridia bacterium]
MTRTFLKKVSLVVFVVILSLVFSGCQGEQTESPDQNSEERVLTILQGVDATTLDPNMHSESPTATVDRQMFDSLLDQSEEMEVVPSLASEWEMVEPTVWKFKLREDVFFHDGEQFTAEDVVFTLERIKNPENNSSQIGNFKEISEVVAEDDFNVTIKTAEPYPLLLVRLASLRIVPKHYVEEVGASVFSENPVGTGPYIFEEWVKDEHIKLNANEDYWQGIPEVKKVVFKPVPESAARVMALQAGEADIIDNLPPHQVEDVENAENSKVGQADSTRFIMLVFTTKNEVVSDVNVRKAINMSIDKESIVENIFSGRATVTAQPVGNYDLGFKQDLESYAYDAQEAQRLLSEAGYEDGVTLKMGSPSGRYPMDKEVAEAIASQLNSNGFDVDLSFEEWGSYATNTLQGNQDYDLWLIGWGSSTFDAGSTLDFWLNTSLVTSYYQDEEVNPMLDSLLNESKSTVDDSQRAQLYEEVIQIAHDNAAFVPLYQQVNLYGMSQRVNWTPRADEVIRAFNISWED